MDRRVFSLKNEIQIMFKICHVLINIYVCIYIYIYAMLTLLIKDGFHLRVLLVTMKASY